MHSSVTQKLSSRTWTKFAGALLLAAILVTVDFSEGENEFLERDGEFWVKVMENPVRDAFRLHYLTQSDNPLEIRILDLSGKIIYQGTLKGYGQKMQMSIPVHHWTAGVYTLQATGKDYLITEKLIVQGDS